MVQDKPSPPHFPTGLSRGLPQTSPLTVRPSPYPEAPVQAARRWGVPGVRCQGAGAEMPFAFPIRFAPLAQQDRWRIVADTPGLMQRPQGCTEAAPMPTIVDFPTMQ